MIDAMPLWAAPFGVGFALSFSLILAIGAQNAFVLRQGLMRQHIGVLVLFCALSDAVLILAGVAGLAPLLAQWLVSVERWLFAGAAGWLAIEDRVDCGRELRFPGCRGTPPRLCPLLFGSRGSPGCEFRLGGRRSLLFVERGVGLCQRPLMMRSRYGRAVPRAFGWVRLRRRIER